MKREALGLLETAGLTPALAAIDAMEKQAGIRVLEVELNDLCGICVKVGGSVEAVAFALDVGRQIAETMNGEPVVGLITALEAEARPAVLGPREYNPLIEQDVVFHPATSPSANSTESPRTTESTMQTDIPSALGLIETQGFTAAFEAVDTACKAANVQVVGKEKLGGGYVTIIIKGELSAVNAAVEAGRAKIDGLGKFVAAHVIARSSEAVLSLLPRP